ncbi:hypothetical protein CVT91_03330 [Candidatus Atribacteria bacterium HGW-Atribacteria-1]|nr:MAG: hypothetical protein CVT91_03330 [Candidatus Atribacteria bacterium HGW-Atribacteria-1]
MKKELFKVSLIYGTGLMLTSAMSLVTTPVIVRSISLTEYGKFGLLVSGYNFLGIIFSLSLGAGLFRYSAEASVASDKVEFNDYIYNSFIIVLSTSSIGAVIIAIFGYCRGNMIFIAVAILSFIMANEQNFRYILRAQNKAIQYFLMSVIYSGVYAVGIIVQFIRGKLDFNSLIILIALSLFCSFAFAVSINWTSITSGHLSRKIALNMIFFSIPLLGAYCVEYMLQFTDIWMLAWLSGKEEVAFFNLAKKVTLALVIIKSTFFLAWPYFAYRFIDQKTHQSIFDILTLCVLIASNILILFRNPIILFLGGKIYLSNSSLLLAPLLSGMVLSITGTFIDTTAGISKKTAWVAGIVIIGLLADVIGNYFLIPLWGAKGAAVATSISYLLMYIVRLIVYSKKMKFRGWTIKSVYITLFITSCYIFLVGIFNLNTGISILITSVILCFAYFREILYLSKRFIGIKKESIVLRK